MISLNDRLAVFLRQRKGQWVNARALMDVAGFAGWRTRVSNLRKAPYNMCIVNEQRQRKVRGVTYRDSYYLFWGPLR